MAQIFGVTWQAIRAQYSQKGRPYGREDHGPGREKRRLGRRFDNQRAHCFVGHGQRIFGRAENSLF